MRRVLFLLALFGCLVSFGQEKNPTYPKLKQLKEKDLQIPVFPKANKKGLWGYVNEKDHYVIKAVFDSAEPFRTDRSTGMKELARVVSSGKVGYLLRDARYLAPPVFDTLSGLEEGVIYFTRDDKKGFLDLDGEVVVDNLEDLQPFSGRDYAWVCRHGLWGAVSRDGDMRIAFVFTELPVIAESGIWRVTIDEKQGLLRADDLSFVLRPEYDAIELDPDHRLLYAKQNGLYAVFRENGEQLTDYLFPRRPIYVDGVMKFFRDGKPWLLLSDGRCLSAGEYEQELRSSKSRYLRDKVLPGPMKPHFREDSEKYANSWQLPSRSASGSFRFVYSDWELEREDDEEHVWFVDAEPLGTVVMDKSGGLYDYSGRVYGSLLSNLTVDNPDSGSQKLGYVLSILFKTVNTSRITRFDTKNGTDLFHDWKSIRFVIYGGIWTGDYRLYAANMFIDCGYQSYFVQRWYFLLDGSDQIVSRWSEDGDVNNPDHPVNRDSFNLIPADGNGFLVVEDWKDLSEFGNRVYKTTLRDSKGNVLGFYTGEFMPYAVAVGKEGFRLFGIGPYGDAFEGANGLGCDDSIVFSWDGELSYSNMPYLRGWTRRDALQQYGESFIAMISDGIVVGTCPLGPGSYFTALKYQEDPWEEGAIVSVATNYYHPQNWDVYVREPSNRLEPFPDVKHTRYNNDEFKFVSVFPDEAGYYRYVYSHYTYTRYGYLGNGRMTQAIFDEAGPFQGGKAEVVICGKKKTITLKDLAPYLSK